MYYDPDLVMVINFLEMISPGISSLGRVCVDYRGPEMVLLIVLNSGCSNRLVVDPSRITASTGIRHFV